MTVKAEPVKDEQRQVEWVNPRSGEVKRLTFWQGIAQGVSLMLLCTDAEGRFRAYRAEECRAVQP